MNKKTAVALAVGAIGAASSVPALAQVEIYGRLYPQLNSVEGSGATNPADNHKRRFTIDTSNSRIGFRGQEKLGGDMAALFQIETRVRFDAGADLWAANRDSFVGLRTSFGTVKFGNMDTVYKTYGAAVGNFFGVSSGNFVSSSNVLSELGVARGGEDGEGRDGQADSSGFHVRMANSVQYESPEFGGFQVGAQWSADERKGNPVRPRGVSDLKADLWSAAVKYEAGPIYASVQIERHNDWLDASTNFDSGTSTAFGGLGTTTTDSKDTAMRASGKFAITPQHRVTGDLARMQWKESGPVGSGEYKRVAWAVGWEASWGGPWRTEVTYTKANKGDCSVSVGTCSTDGLEGKQFAAGVGYALSKRTTLYAIGAKLTNGENAAFDNVNAINPSLGEDIKQLAVGMVHSF